MKKIVRSFVSSPLAGAGQSSIKSYFSTLYLTIMKISTMPVLPVKKSFCLKGMMFSFIAFLMMSSSVFATDYYWIGGAGGGSTNVGATGTLSTSVGGTSAGAITLAATDRLIFDGADIDGTGGSLTGTTAITFSFGSTTLTLGQLVLKNSVNVTFSNASARNINVGGGLSGTDLDIQAGSTFLGTCAANIFTLALTTGNVGNIAGTLIIGPAGTSNSSTFTIADLGSLTVANGGTWVHAGQGGISTPLGNAVFSTGSTMIFRGSSVNNVANSITARTFYNLSFESASGVWTPTMAGSGTLTVNGTFNIGGAGAGTVTVGSGYTGIPTVAALTIKASCTYTPGGNLVVNGVFTNNGTFTHNSKTITFGTGGDINGTAATTFFGLTINTTATTDIVTMTKNNAGIANAGTLTLTKGIFKIGTGNQFFVGTNASTTISAVGGTTSGFATTGTNGSDGGTILLDSLGGSGGTCTITSTGLLTFYNLQDGKTPGSANTNIAITNANTIFINGTFTLLENGPSISKAPIYGPNSTLYYNRNNQGYNVGGGNEWNATSGYVIGTTPGYPNNVIIVNAGTSNGSYNSTNVGVAITTAVNINGMLTVGDGTIACVVGINNSGFTCGGVTINNNSTLSVTSNITVNGNWLRQGATIGLFKGGTSSVIFGGSGTAAAPQTIGLSTGTETSFYNVALTNGTYVKLNSPVTLPTAGALTLTSGKLETTSTNILSITNTATTGITGTGSATNCITGPVKWSLLNSAATYIFPVAAGTSTITYLPLTFTSKNTTSSNVATVQAFATGSGGSAGAGLNSGSVSTSEYWSLATSSGLTATGSTVTIARPTAISPLDIIGKSTTAAGTYTTAGGSASGSSGTTGDILTTSPWFFAFAQLPVSIITIADNTVVPAAYITGTNNIVSRFQVGVSSVNATLNTVNFTTTGSATSSDVTNFKLLYSATNSFGSAAPIGSTITTSTGATTHSFTGLTQAIIAGNSGYFWITADIASGATLNRTLQVAAMANTDISFAAGNKSGSVSQSGLQTIAAAPTVTTGSFTSTLTSITLNGTVNNNFAASTAASFDYGTGYSLNAAATTNPSVTGGSSTAIAVTINSLTENTDYLYRAKGINSLGTTTGTGTFTATTVSKAPTVGTATLILANGFRANWTAPTGQGSAAYTYTVEADDDSNFGSVDGSQSGVTNNFFVFNTLSSGTTYYYRVKVVNAGGISAWSATSASVTTTNPTAPVLSTPTATSITHNSAILGATIVSDGASTIDYDGTAFSTTSPVASTDNGSNQTSDLVGDFSYSRSPLSPQTFYYYIGYAHNGIGTGLSPEGSFWTLSNPPTSAAGGFGATASAGQVQLDWTTAAFPGSGASANGYLLIRKSGATNPTTSGITNGIAPASLTVDGSLVTTITSGSTLTYTNTGLSVGTTYRYIIVPFTWNGTDPETYNYYITSAPTANATTPSAPTATTGSASAITINSATLNGTVSANLASTIVTFNYGLTTSYTDNVTAAQSPVSAQTVSVTASIGSLTANTIYHVMVSAVNSVSTTNGSDATFTTIANAPVIGAGSAPTSVGFTANWSAVSGNGTVTYTIEVDNDINFGSIDKTVTGVSGTSSVITGLSAATTYYYRVKAVNTAGGTSGVSATSVAIVTGDADSDGSAPSVTGINSAADQYTIRSVQQNKYLYDATGTSGSFLSYDNATITPPASPATVGSKYFWYLNPGVTGSVKNVNTSNYIVYGSGSYVGYDGANNWNRIDLLNQTGYNGYTDDKRLWSFSTVSGTIYKVTCGFILSSYGYYWNTNVSPNATNTFSGGGSVSYQYQVLTSSVTTGTSQQFDLTKYAAVPDFEVISVTNSLGGGNASVGAPFTATATIRNNGLYAFPAGSVKVKFILDGKIFTGTLTSAVAASGGTATVSATITPNLISAGSPINVTVNSNWAIAEYNYGNNTFASSNVVVEPASTKPIVLTTDATSVTTTSATFNGTVNPNGFATDVTFDYGTSTSYTNSIVATGSPITTNLTSTANVSKATGTVLAPQTLYHYRVTGENSGGIRNGNDVTFWTWSNAPTAQAASVTGTATSQTTSTLSNISLTIATAATFPSSGATKAGYLVVYSTGTPSLVASPNGKSLAAAVSNGTIISTTETSLPTAPSTTVSLTGVASCASYNFLVVPYTWNGTNDSTRNYLTASAATAAVATTSNAYNGTQVAWTVGTTIQAEDWDYGGEGCAYHEGNQGVTGVAYRTDGNSNTTPWLQNAGTGKSIGYGRNGEYLVYTVNVPATGNYKFDLNYSSTDGRTLGVDVYVDGVNKTSLAGNSQTYTTYTTSSIALTAGTRKIKIQFTTDEVNFDYFKFYGSPALTTPTVTAITSTSATLGATVTSNGGVTLTARGTAYKANTSGVTATDNPLAEGSTSVSAYTHTRSPLTPQTLYYFVGYATNSVGTSISTESSFRTLSSVATAQASGLTATPASSTSINLNWTAGTKDANATAIRYIILRQTGASAPSTTGIVNGGDQTTFTSPASTTYISTATGNTYTDATVSAGVQYTYIVLAYTYDGTNDATRNYLLTVAAGNTVTRSTSATITSSVIGGAGGHGTVSPNGATTISYGANQTFTFTPSACYRVSNVSVDGGANNTTAVINGFYTFTNVTANHTVAVTFALATYSITVTQNNNGFTDPDPATVTCGSDQTFTFTPDGGYHVASVIIDGDDSSPEAAQAVLDGSYTFSNVTANHTIEATYAVDCSGYTWVGAGADPSDFYAADNWQCGIAPPSNTPIDMSVQTGASSPIPGNIEIGNLSIPSGASIDLNGHELTISGELTGDGTFIGSATSDLVISNTATITSPITFADGADIVRNLTVSADATLGHTLNIATVGSEAGTPGTVIVNAGVTFNTGGYLVLRSDATGTARIGESLGTISGDVTTERYIRQNTRRGWRLLSVPVEGTQSIHDAWQEGASGYSDNPVPGYGTRITVKDGNTLGCFDANTYSNSLLYYDIASASFKGQTASTCGTDVSRGAAGDAWMIYVRGDRSLLGDTSQSIIDSTSTVLRVKGPLYTAPYPSLTVDPSYTYGTLMGNIVPSEIDFTKLNRSGTIANSFRMWDPLLNDGFNVGGYVLISGGAGWVPDRPTANHPAVANSTIPSGAGFFVKAVGSAGTVQILESSKSNGADVSGAGFRPSAPSSAVQSVKANLYSNVGGTEYLASVARVFFADTYNNAVDVNDDAYQAPAGVGLAITRTPDMLSNENRNKIVSGDVIPYNIFSPKAITYRLELVPGNLSGTGVVAVVEDKYLNTPAVVMSLDDATSIEFTANPAVAASYSNRFRVVFSVPTPVGIVTVHAQQHNTAMQLDWNTAAESGVKQYEVEHSADGTTFTKIGTLAATGNTGAGAAYSYTDASPDAGINYYRIKITDLSGSVKYSTVVKVTYGPSAVAAITLNTNLVSSGRISLQLTGQPKGKYGIRVINSLGQELLKTSFEHGGTNSTESVSLPPAAKGVYQLEIVKPNGTRQTEKLLVN